MLEASYEATLWAAVLEQQQGKGSGTVFLTFVGGGVFRNKPEWIHEAIARACFKCRAHPIKVKVCHHPEVSGEAQEAIVRAFEARCK